VAHPAAKLLCMAAKMQETEVCAQMLGSSGGGGGAFGAREGGVCLCTLFFRTC
jgi:hypothetical protein